MTHNRPIRYRWQHLCLSISRECDLMTLKHCHVLVFFYLHCWRSGTKEWHTSSLHLPLSLANILHSARFACLVADVVIVPSSSSVLGLPLLLVSSNLPSNMCVQLDSVLGSCGRSIAAFASWQWLQILCVWRSRSTPIHSSCGLSSWFSAWYVCNMSSRRLPTCQCRLF